MDTVTVRLIIFARWISRAVAGSGQLIWTGNPNFASSPNLIFSGRSCQVKVVPSAEPVETTVAEVFVTLNLKALLPPPPVEGALSRTQ